MTEDKDTAHLKFETAIAYDGLEGGEDTLLFRHRETGETIVEDRINDVEEKEKWLPVTYCPRCSTVLPDEDELVDAGFLPFHEPCATEDELEVAVEAERVWQMGIDNARLH